MNIVVAITGATGAIYGVKLLHALKALNVTTHLVISKWGEKTLALETDYSLEQLKKFADFYYDNDDLGAAISSGSFKTSGMVVVPCSMKTLAGISCGLSTNLIQRVADVMIKEKRKLILVTRETPLSPIHLENMLKLSKIGVVIMPPMPGFYSLPETIDEIVSQHVGRILDSLDIEHEFIKRWK
jgi:4-hydroxy-3-polyprenylbenzoate decarboxylase